MTGISMLIMANLPTDFDVSQINIPINDNYDYITYLYDRI
jgi:hypothetical protein